METGSYASRETPPVCNLLQIKSKFQAEFRRFPVHIDRDAFEDFNDRIESIHHLSNFGFVITYTDPVHGDLLPINNEDNFAKAKKSCLNGIMRVYVHKKDNLNLMNGFGQSTVRRRKGRKNVPKISFPEDFRPVSAIIDVDILPETLRRVRLHNHGINKPLGFFIRDGVSLRMSDNGLEKVPGIFISRLVQGGLAEMTGLLAVNDEVLEVNGIEVGGKSLDQVTDMMVANSSNLIITVKPASMRNAVGSTRISRDRHPQTMLRHHNYESDEEDDDADIIKDIYSASPKSSSDRSDRVSGDHRSSGTRTSPIPPKLIAGTDMMNISQRTPTQPASRQPDDTGSGRKSKPGRDSVKAKRSNDTGAPTTTM